MINLHIILQIHIYLRELAVSVLRPNYHKVTTLITNKCISIKRKLCFQNAVKYVYLLIKFYTQIYVYTCKLVCKDKLYLRTILILILEH